MSGWRTQNEVDEGVTPGGLTGQVLTKQSNLDGDVDWQDPPGSAGGEENIGQNIGTLGFGLYSGKSGVALQFKNVHGPNPELNITQDANNNLLFTVNTAQINHNVLLNSGTNTHATIDSHLGNSSIHFTESSINTDNVTEGSTNLFFTSAERTKLDGLDDNLFLGQYTSLTALQTAHPNPGGPGFYAYVDQGAGQDVVVYIWDVDDTQYVLQAGTPTTETPASIKTKYESNANTNAFTDAEKNKLGAIGAGARVVNVVGGANVTVDAVDPQNPIVNVPSIGVESVVAGSNVSVDATDPANPIISASVSGVGLATWTSVSTQTSDYTTVLADDGTKILYGTAATGDGRITFRDNPPDGTQYWLRNLNEKSEGKRLFPVYKGVDLTPVGNAEGDVKYVYSSDTDDWTAYN
jgi:hypothetical protein